jgi:hypothetical protein
VRSRIAGGGFGDAFGQTRESDRIQKDGELSRLVKTVEE